MKLPILNTGAPIPPEFVPPGVAANFGPIWPGFVRSLARNIQQGNAQAAGKLAYGWGAFDMTDAASIQLTIRPVIKGVNAPGLPAAHAGDVYTI